MDLNKLLNKLLNEEPIGNVETTVSLEIPVNATHHSIFRYNREGYEGITTEEILNNIKKGARQVVGIFLKQGNKHFNVKNVKNHLNVIIAVNEPPKSNRLTFDVITVIKKQNFKEKQGTKVIAVE